MALGHQAGGRVQLRAARAPGAGRVRGPGLSFFRARPLHANCCAPPPLGQDNLIHGRFLAELTKEVFADLEASKYQHTGAGVG